VKFEKKIPRKILRKTKTPMTIKLEKNKYVEYWLFKGEGP